MDGRTIPIALLGMFVLALVLFLIHLVFGTWVPAYLVGLAIVFILNPIVGVIGLAIFLFVY